MHAVLVWWVGSKLSVKAHVIVTVCHRCGSLILEIYIAQHTDAAAQMLSILMLSITDGRADYYFIYDVCEYQAPRLATKPKPVVL